MQRDPAPQDGCWLAGGGADVLATAQLQRLSFALQAPDCASQSIEVKSRCSIRDLRLNNHPMGRSGGAESPSRSPLSWGSVMLVYRLALKLALSSAPFAGNAVLAALVA